MIVIKHQRGAEKYTANLMAKLAHPKFIEDSKSVSMFDPEYTSPKTITGYDILLPLLNASGVKINLGFYTQNWWAYRFAPVNAYVDYTGRNIFLNTRQLWRGLRDIEETLAHELCHVSDAINPNATYWHGDNNLKGKDQTAPVKFAKWIAEWTI